MTSRSAFPLRIGVEQGYALWSRTYDSECNPFLTLEERYLERLLPEILGRDVLDIGCGTGRWLAKFTDRGANSLTGVDFSEAMLGVAREKLGDAANLQLQDAGSLRLPPSSADVILCSFTLSYVEEVSALARALRHIARPGTSMYFSDLHPETIAKLDWKRSFRQNGVVTEIETYAHSLSAVVRAFEDAGFQTTVHLEPKFGGPERTQFLAAGKEHGFATAATYPAIYVLQFVLPIAVNEISGSQSQSYIISGARIGLGAQESCFAAMEIANSRVRALHADPERESSFQLDLSDYLLLPGIVNAHDHLEFGLFPRLGREASYTNFQEWVNDIYRPDESPIRELRAIPKSSRLWWGGLRNLLCGVTTVCHHNPYHPEVFTSDFPIRVLREFNWAHSLALEPDAAQRKSQLRPGRPFILHLGEGTDAAAVAEFAMLREGGALDSDTVIVHGLALHESDIAALRDADAGLVWCPTSNTFLFGTTLSPDSLAALPKVAIGSDSPLTAAGNLLDEVRFARVTLGANTDALFHWVTTSAAKLLALRDGAGTLRVGAFADLIAVRDSQQTPGETLAAISYRDVELVIIAGRVQLVSCELFERLPNSSRAGLEPITVGGVHRWVRAPVLPLFTEAERHLGGRVLLGGREVRPGHRN